MVDFFNISGLVKLKFECGKQYFPTETKCLKHAFCNFSSEAREVQGFMIFEILIENIEGQYSRIMSK